MFFSLKLWENWDEKFTISCEVCDFLGALNGVFVDFVLFLEC